jgi:hypothetical protein
VSAPGRPKAPAGLAVAGKRLWSALTADYEFGPAELATLELACRQADDVALLEQVVAADGVVTTGSKGQVRAHPALGELRLSRQALARLLGLLALPGEDDDTPRTAAGRRGQKAARARWDRQARRRGEVA